MSKIKNYSMTQNAKTQNVKFKNYNTLAMARHINPKERGKDNVANN